MTRREFIETTAVAALSVGCATTRRATDIVDTHTHFYDPTRPQGVPWPEKKDSFLYRPVLPAELKRIAQPLGVRGTVVVEASAWPEDNAWVLELAKNDPFILGLVGHLNPGQREFRQDLERFSAHPLFRGIRIGGAAIALSDADFIRDTRLLAHHGLSLDVLGGPDSLPKVAALADAVPELRIVINHCAGVQIDGKAPAADWV
jgi:L-fuconolactonase